MTGLGKAFLLHPKKATFFSGVTSLAVWFTYDNILTNDTMKYNCMKAAKYGDERMKNHLGNMKHVTVILNPIAGNRKSKKLYTNFVEPILHLAGFKVSLMETNSPNQAYELMNIMSNCDGVAIVGGDGTVHEALNGLLDRLDKDEAVRRFPIAIIPTGNHNSIARYLHQGFVNYRNQKEFLMNATMKLVENSTTKYDVLKIDSLSGDNDTSHDQKTTYALRDVRFGIYQDNFFKVGGYYYYEQYIKPYWMRFKRLTSRSKYQAPKIDSISYTEPCIGCSKCINRHKLSTDGMVDKQQENQSSNKRWWSVLGSVGKKSKSGPSEAELKEIELAKRDNPDCGKWINLGDTNLITDFRACMMGDKKVRLSVGRNREFTPSDVTEAQDVRLKLSAELDSEMKSVAQKELDASISKNEGEEKKSDESNSKEVDRKDVKKPTQFLIDGQPIQAHSIEITAIDKAVTVFTGAPKFV